MKYNTKELTNEALDHWLGDATNKQARINLFYECKYDLELLESVLDHWLERLKYIEENCECGLLEDGTWSEELFDQFGCTCE